MNLLAAPEEERRRKRKKRKRKRRKGKRGRERGHVVINNLIKIYILHI